MIDYSQDHVIWFYFYPEQIDRVFSERLNLCQNERGPAYAVRDVLQDDLNKFCFAYYSEQCGAEYFAQCYTDYWAQCRDLDLRFQGYSDQACPEVRIANPFILPDGTTTTRLGAYVSALQLSTLEQLHRHWIWQAPGSERDRINVFDYAQAQVENLLLKSLPEGENSADIFVRPLNPDLVDTCPGILQNK